MSNFLNTIDTEFDNIQKIRESIFDTKVLRLNTGLEGFDAPEKYGVYKSTGGECLGVVGKTYAPQDLEVMLESIT